MTLTPEVLLSLALISVSVLSVSGIVIAVKSTPRHSVNRNIDHAVRNAPYHRLHNIALTERS